MSKLFYIYLLGFVLCFVSCGLDKQNEISSARTNKAGLTWYDIQDLEKIDLGNKRVIVDMYTSWCGWCKKMDQITFTNSEVVKYLNENFVVVKFNAERRDPVTFQGETYEWLSTGRRGVNKLALKLMDGRMGYPTLVYLDNDLNKIKTSAGYKTAPQLLDELRVL